MFSCQALNFCSVLLHVFDWGCLQAPELHAQLHAQMRAQQEEEVRSLRQHLSMPLSLGVDCAWSSLGAVNDLAVIKCASAKHQGRHTCMTCFLHTDI